MLILFLKSAADAEKPLTLPQKLRIIFTARVKEAKTDEDKSRAQRELEQYTGSSSD